MNYQYGAAAPGDIVPVAVCSATRMRRFVAATQEIVAIA